MKFCRLLFLSGIGLAAHAHAQPLVVLDRSTLQSIAGVALSSEAPLVISLTNSRGEVDLSAFTGSVAINVQHISYQPMLLTFQELQGLGTLYLSARAYSLDEFVLSASRFEEKRRDVPERIEVIKARDIGFLDQPTTAELLQNSGAVFVQKSQLGGGSPVIRGFEASRVLLVVDGVRMNNAIYRAGHLQDLITVDQNALERVEVISGPASVVYGSDALGGVVHMVTRTAAFSDTALEVGGDAFVRYATASMEKTAHASLELRGRRLASYTSITACDFGDLRQGSIRNPFYEDFGRRSFHVVRENGTDVVQENDDSNVQIGTAYRQLDFLEKLRLRTGERTTHQLNLQLSTSSDVPRYDRLTEFTLDTAWNIVPAQAEWYYGPQKRFLAAYTFETTRERGIFQTARFTPSYQAIAQSRHSRGFGSSRLGSNEESVAVIGFNADLEKRIGRNELRYGLEANHNSVKSEAYRKHIETGEITYRSTRYPGGGSTVNSVAAYLSHTIELNEKWVISEGLRLTHVGLEATFNDTTDYQFLNGTHVQTNSAISWRAGIMFMPGSDWRYSALASTGFRAPNVDDMGKVFDSAPGLVVVPNPDLKPETTTNFELGLNKTFDRSITIEGNAFYTLYTNALTLGDHLVNGEDSIDYDGTLSRVTTLTNAGEAYLYGASGSFIAEFSERWTLRSSLTYTYGRIRTDSTDYPLDHIPPVYGRTALELHVKRLRAEVYAIYNGWKRLHDYNLVGEDNIQYATAQGMPAWYTLNVRASIAFNKSLAFTAALENIGDMNYRTFGSGVSGAGRNLMMSLRAVF